MYIEDIIILLDGISGISGWDKSFINNVAAQLVNGHGLTPKQSNVAVKIIQRYKALCPGNQTQIEQLIKNPEYRLKSRDLANAYQASIENLPDIGRVLKLEFPYNAEYINLIKANRKNFNTSIFDRDKRAWFFDFSENSLVFLSTLHELSPFEMDSELSELLTQTQQVLRSPEQYVPMLTLQNETLAYQNVPNFVPEIRATDVISGIIEARKYGITVWDEKIDDFLKDYSDEILMSLLNLDPTRSLGVDRNIHSISALKNVLKFMDPCLIIVPAGEEYQKLSMFHEFLIAEGYDNKSMSVMFRLSSEKNGKNFNDFIKNQGLNNPISEHTRFVFICGKVPKPIFKSNIKFQCVINLGFYHVHYTIKDYVKNCQNVLYYTDQQILKDIQLVNL